MDVDCLARQARRLVAGLVVAMSSACSRSSGDVVAPPLPPGPLEAAPRPSSLEIDLGDVMRRARFAFLPAADGESLESGSSTWLARLVGSKVRLWVGTSGDGGAISLGESVLGRGEWSWTAPHLSAGEDGALRRSADGIIETLEAREAGIEQSWSFEHAPPGAGDLSVSIVVSDAISAAESGGRVRLGGESGEVVYGAAKWIDASGAVTPIPAGWVDGAIRFVVPADLVASAIYPVVLDPLVGPEIETPSDLGHYDEEHVDILADEGHNVACTTTVCGVFYTDSMGLKIRRLDAAGAALDPLPKLLVPSETLVDVAATGTTFFVLSSDTNNHILRRVDASGALLSTVFTFPMVGADEGLACSSTICLVTTIANGSLVGKRIASDGTDLDPFGFVILGQAQNSRDLRAAFNGTEFLVSNNADRVARVLPNGTVLDPLGITVTGVERIRTDGASFLVRTGTNPNYMTTVVNANGSKGTPTAFSFASSDFDWIGGSYLATHPNVSGQRYTSSGQIVGSTISYGSGFGHDWTNVANVPGGGGYVCGYGSGAASDWMDDLTCIYVDTNGAQQGARIPINNSAAPMHNAVVIAGNNQYLLAWADRRIGKYGVYAQLYDPAGAPLGAPFLIRNNGVGMTVPQVVSGAFDGTNYVVASCDPPSVTNGRASRVTPAGVNLDGAGYLTNMNVTAVSFDGTNYVFSGVRAGSLQWSRMVAATGGVSAGGSIANASQADGIGASYDGTFHVVVYRDTALNKIVAARISTTGTLVGTPTAIPQLATRPTIACAPGGVGCLTAGGGVGAYARWPSGSVQTAAPLADTVGRSALTSNGSEFIQVVDNVLQGSEGIQFARFSTGDPAQQQDSFFSISADPTATQPSVASVGAGFAMVAYERWVPAESAFRVLVRVVSPGGATLGTACSSDAECSSQHCTDGVCCNQICYGGPDDCQTCAASLGASADGVCTLLASGAGCAPGFTPDLCQKARTCNGVSPICPGSQLEPPSKICRPSTGPCDPFEHCSGFTPTCPVDVLSANGAACDDGDACTLADTCQNLSCVAGSSVTCVASDACHQPGTCNTISGVCSNPPQPDGVSCADSDACTVNDTCQAGVCTAGPPTTCPPPDQCHTGTCEMVSGMCVYPVLPDGTSCDDGDPCTPIDTCQSGTCVAGVPTTCTPATECVSSACDNATGACVESPLSDGTTCAMGACSNGACVPAAASTSASSSSSGSTSSSSSSTSASSSTSSSTSTGVGGSGGASNGATASVAASASGAGGASGGTTASVAATTAGAGGANAQPSDASCSASIESTDTDRDGGVTVIAMMIAVGLVGRRRARCPPTANSARV